MVQPHQLRHLPVVAHRPERAPDRSALEQPLQSEGHADCYAEDQHRQRAYREPAPERDAVGVQPAGRYRAWVGAVYLLEQILDHDCQPERDHQGRQRIAAQRAVEEEALEPVAGTEPKGQQHCHGRPRRHGWRQTARERQREGDEPSEDDEITVRDVGQPHHAEDQRLAHGEQSVQSAEQDALHDGVDPAEPSIPEVRLRNLLARERARGTRQRHAALLQTVQPARHHLRHADVLLDDDRRQPTRAHARQDVVDLLHHDGRQAERDLVADQQARVAHQGAPDRHHLLLPARQRGAGYGALVLAAPGTGVHGGRGSTGHRGAHKRPSAGSLRP